jgi:hypothetical protein
MLRVVADANVLVSAALARDDVLDAAEQMAQASTGMLHVTRTDGRSASQGRWTSYGDGRRT